MHHNGPLLQVFWLGFVVKALIEFLVLVFVSNLNSAFHRLYRKNKLKRQIQGLGILPGLGSHSAGVDCIFNVFFPQTDYNWFGPVFFAIFFLWSWSPVLGF